MELRERIIKTAYEMFSAYGYEKTTIGGIIKHAGCAKGGFYHHFKSKEEILEIIVSRQIETLKKEIDTHLLEPDLSFEERFGSIFRTVVDFKLRQFEDWAKADKMYIFSGNDRVLRSMERQFKKVIDAAYFQVIKLGNETKDISEGHSELKAKLCTRELLWILEASLKLIVKQSLEQEDWFDEVVTFSEEVLAHALGVETQKLGLKNAAQAYLKEARKLYPAEKEESS